LTPLTTKKVNFIVEYLTEDEDIRIKALTHGSGAQMELFMKKTGGRKSRDRVPLKGWSHEILVPFFISFERL
jgi:hypothetical protein